MALTPRAWSLATVAFEVSKPSTSSTQAGTSVSTLPWSCHCQAAVVGSGAQRPAWVESTLAQTELTAAAAGATVSEALAIRPARGIRQPRASAPAARRSRTLEHDDRDLAVRLLLGGDVVGPGL